MTEVDHRGFVALRNRLMFTVPSLRAVVTRAVVPVAAVVPPLLVSAVPAAAPIGAVVVATAVVMSLAVDAADPSDKPATARRGPPGRVERNQAAGHGPAAGRERFTVSGPGGRRSLEGAVVVEAEDGGVLVESDDERLELFQPQMILAREAATGAADESPREIGRRILGELPAGFDLLVTRHYCVCFDTSRAYAQWCAALFERLHDAFTNFWTQAGLDMAAPRRPLVVVIFADRQRYEAFAARDLGAATDRVIGYYNLMSNRVTTFDLTGSAGLPRPAGSAAARAGLEILGSPEAAGMVSTLVHEATHQMAFNGGLHRRLAPVPLWLSEGVATYFETPDLSNDRGWKGIGNVNSPRLERFLTAHRPGTLERIVADDEPFRTATEPLDAYARAWALTFFLIQTRKPAFVKYLRLVGRKEPLAEDSPAERLRDFKVSFGASPNDLEEQVFRHLTRLRGAAR